MRTTSSFDLPLSGTRIWTGALSYDHRLRWNMLLRKLKNFGLSFRPAEVVDRERSDVPASLLRPPQGNGRINAAGQEDDRPFHSVTAKSFGPAASHAAGREAEASAP